MGHYLGGCCIGETACNQQAPRLPASSRYWGNCLHPAGAEVACNQQASPLQSTPPFYSAQLPAPPFLFRKREASSAQLPAPSFLFRKLLIPCPAPKHLPACSESLLVPCPAPTRILVWSTCILQVSLHPAGPSVSCRAACILQAPVSS